jgi:site-specific recombinase XerD
VFFSSDEQKSVSNFLNLRHKFVPTQKALGAASTPGAQSPVLYASREYQNLQKSITNIMAKSNTQLSSYVKAIIELQLIFGLRISESLSITGNDVMPNGTIKVKGAKHSNDRFVFPILYQNFWLHLKNTQYLIPKSFNRFYFYRIYKKFGIYSVLGSNTNASVTHVIRYLFILGILQHGETIENVQRLIGHKSVKSTQHYISNL